MNRSPKEKAASPWQGKAAGQTNLDLNNTAFDPLRKWFDLAAGVKPSSINRHQKRRRNQQRGALDLQLAGWLLLCAISAAMLAGVAT